MKNTAFLRLMQEMEDLLTGRQPWFDPEQPRACYPEMEDPERRDKRDEQNNQVQSVG